MTTSSHMSGGDTKILVIDHNIKLSVFASKLTSLCDTPYAVVYCKYQLPSEDLDALNSVTNDEDLDHMMIKYDCSKAKTTKIHVSLAWEPPETGVFKLNVDGSQKNGSGAIGAGGMIRDSFGAWIGGFVVNLGIVWKQSCGGCFLVSKL